MAQVILFNKPYGVLAQFTDQDRRPTLKHYIDVNGVYPAGRLDRDSEGLLVLTDNGKLQQRITAPRFKLAKTYLVQVENIPDTLALKTLRSGVELNDGTTRPAIVERIEEPELWLRDPPVRYRARIPTCWLRIVLTEGRNRQLRRMTAAVGYPTLRLVRYAVGPWTIENLPSGTWRFLDKLGLKCIEQEADYDLETTCHRRGHYSGRSGKISDGRRAK